MTCALCVGASLCRSTANSQLSVWWSVRTSWGTANSVDLTHWPEGKLNLEPFQETWNIELLSSLLPAAPQILLEELNTGAALRRLTQQCRICGEESNGDTDRLDHRRQSSMRVTSRRHSACPYTSTVCLVPVMFMCALAAATTQRTWSSPPSVPPAPRDSPPPPSLPGWTAYPGRTWEDSQCADISNIVNQVRHCVTHSSCICNRTLHVGGVHALGLGQLNRTVYTRARMHRRGESAC
jgi:hypothetical protein